MDMPSLFFKYLFHKHPKKRKEKGDGVRVMKNRNPMNIK
jgi:hypothetical protein